MKNPVRTWRFWLIVVGCAYLAVALVIPLLALLVETVRAGVPDVLRHLATRETAQALGLSVAVAAVCVAANAAFGIAAAIVLVRHRFPGRRMLDALVDLSLAVSPVMIGLAMLLLFGRSGVLYPVLERLGLQVAFAVPGIVLVTLFVTLPFTVREVAYVLEELGEDEELVATTLGASPWFIFRRITLPNISTGLRLGIVLTAARALGEFGAVLVIGGAITGRTQTATTYIYDAVEERQMAAALGMALLLALVSMALLAILTRLRASER